MAASGFSQGFLHVDNKNIVDGNGQNVLLRGMGLGGWMLQEGYMMKTAEFANAQYQLVNKIKALIGDDKTAEFYDAWLENYVQKADIDSMKKWGFNSIRLPMHYNLYTLPIEQEPVKNQNTWLDKGFELTDRLLGWCAENEMYLILDLHAAPGGQGYESGISDYDPTKPSLWESEENQNKTIALWKKLAERYANEPWIGGYDLINETNWDMDNNKPLKDLSVAITNAIREVDKNHIIYIEGNWFANDFTGMTPPWDDNMVYSFHKYWSINDQGSIQWMLDIRNQHNIPIWCGESGENSNTWFTDAIKLFEKNNIGWAWWPYKKIEEIDGPLDVLTSDGYDRLLSYWSGSGSKPTADAAFQGLMDLAENLKLENCVTKKDVIDAMFRQTRTNSTKAFVRHDLPGLIFASDYDLGQNGYAYWDEEVATYHVTTGNFTSWNNGWAFRNDGVDIEECSDTASSNGYSVGWIGKDEWLTYTVHVDETAAYDVGFRISAESVAGKIRMELDDRPVSGVMTLKSTGGWQNWATVKMNGIILEHGTHVLKLYFESDGYNLNFVEINNPTPTHDHDLKCLIASVENDGYTLVASFNKKLDPSLPAAPPGGFSIRTANKGIPVNAFELDDSGYQIVFSLDEKLYFEDQVYLSYSGSAISALDKTVLQPFTDLRARNTLDARHSIPGLIQAEAFETNNGFQLESTTDTGGGQNLGYSDIGDYADYLVTIKDAGTYDVSYRVASESNGGGVELVLIDEASKAQTIHRVTFPATGGWQTWQSFKHSAVLPAGRYTLRIKVTKALFNLNWMQFKFITGVEQWTDNPTRFELAQNYPNPFNPKTTIRFSIPQADHVVLKVYNVLGKEVETLVDDFRQAGEFKVEWNAAQYASGLYFYTLSVGEFEQTRKLIVQR
jgi:aryl-phospho-beta-D-glucosidase BglC (GH1 family)